MKNRKQNAKKKPARKASNRPIRPHTKRTLQGTNLASIPIGDPSTIGPRIPTHIEAPRKGRARAKKQIRALGNREPEYRLLALARAAARTRFLIASFARTNARSAIAGLVAALDEYSRAAQRQLDQLASTFRPHGFETRIVKWRGFAGWPSKIATAWANDGREKAALALSRLGVDEATNAIHLTNPAPLGDDALLKHSAELLKLLPGGAKPSDQDMLEDLLQQELVALRAAELADFLPASCFPKHFRARMRMATHPGRKAKRIRKKKINRVMHYSVSDYMRAWPDAPPPKGAQARANLRNAP